MMDIKSRKGIRFRCLLYLYEECIQDQRWHQFDITGVSTSWRFVSPKDMSEAPERPASKELVEFRGDKAKKADEIIRRMNEKEAK